MSTVLRQCVITLGGVLLAGGLLAGTARAQFPVVRNVGPGITVSTYSVPPERIYDPYGNHRRNAYLLQLYGQAYQNVPPYALGYNPYQRTPPFVVAPTTIVPVVPTPVYPTPNYGPLWNPYANPLAPGLYR